MPNVKKLVFNLRDDEYVKGSLLLRIDDGRNGTVTEHAADVIERLLKENVELKNTVKYLQEK